jgi:hypothetical protein
VNSPPALKFLGRHPWNPGPKGASLGMMPILVVVGSLLGPLADAALASGGDAPSAASPALSSQSELDGNIRTARWMLAYDRVAWETTDLLLKEDKETLRHISPVWFCIERDGDWYAVYGTYNAGSYDIAVCYRKEPGGRLTKVHPPTFGDKDRFARAIDLTLPEIRETTRRTTVRFNDYVRAEGDLIEVYYVPALQPDGKLAYGVQHTYLVDSTGGILVSHIQHGQALIGVFPSRKRSVTLEIPECAVPTPQALFTMMSYREQFAAVVTHCRDGYFDVVQQGSSYACVPTKQPPPDFPSLGAPSTASQ